jgi:hypothetical protein
LRKIHLYLIIGDDVKSDYSNAARAFFRQQFHCLREQRTE